MAAILHTLDQRRLIDTNGIADGASIYFYLTGTLTPAPVYTTAALNVEHSSPIVVASGAAVPDIYLDSSITYRRRIVYPDGTVDDTDPYGSGAALASELASTDSGKGASLIAKETGGTLQEFSRYFNALTHIASAAWANIFNRSGVELSSELQTTLDNVPQGASVYVPSGLYEADTPLTSDTCTTLVGDPGRENADNSWDYGDGGTLIHYTATTGDALTISPPDLDNRRISATLRDFTLRGGLVSDGATAGDGIVLNGRTGYGATFVKADVRNVNVCEFPGRGFSLEGLVYGGKIDSIFAHNNGLNGFGTDAGGANVGEMVLSRVRCFSNGDEGSTDAEKANFYWSAGTMWADMISASEGAGPGILIAGGPVVIGHAQVESNAGSQIVLGKSGASAQTTVVSGLVAPGAAYTGACVHITADTSRTVLGNLYFADSLSGAGTHITRDAAAGQLVMLAAPRAATTLTVDDNANTAIGFLTHAYCQVFARLGTAAANVTGDGVDDVDWKPDTEILDEFGQYDPATGIFTALFSAVYDFEWAIPLDQLGTAHDRATVYVTASTYSRQYFVGNVGAMRDALNRFTIQGRARVPMAGGDTCKIQFNVGGGTKTVDTLGGGTFGFLSITTAH